jgi:putative Holliday junction resolvase
VTSETGRVLAIDFGTRRVGLALSDPLRITASGAGTLANDGALISHLRTLVQDREVVLVVVGLPYAPDGGEGLSARAVRDFIGRLEEALEVPIETWDESFSTVEAQKLLRESGVRRMQRRERGRVDEMAARILLREYLDHHQ